MRRLKKSFLLSEPIKSERSMFVYPFMIDVHCSASFGRCLSVSSPLFSLSLCSSIVTLDQAIFDSLSPTNEICVHSYVRQATVNYSSVKEKERERTFFGHLDRSSTMTTTPTPVGPHSRKKVSYYYDFEVGNYYYG